MDNYHNHKVSFFCKFCYKKNKSDLLRNITDGHKQLYKQVYDEDFKDLGESFPSKICNACRKKFTRAAENKAAAPVLFEHTAAGKKLLKDRKLTGHIDRCKNSKIADQDYDCYFCNDLSASLEPGRQRDQETGQIIPSVQITTPVEKILEDRHGNTLDQPRNTKGQFSTIGNEVNKNTSSKKSSSRKSYTTICNEPLDNGGRCQQLVGRGRNHHNCTAYANAMQIISLTEKTKTEEHVLAKLYRNAEKDLKHLGKDPNLLVIQSIGAPLKITRGSSKKIEKKLSINSIFNLVKTRYSNKTQIKQLLSDVRKSGGTAPNYVDIEREIKARSEFTSSCFNIDRYVEKDISYYDSNNFWLPHSFTQQQYDSHRHSDHIVYNDNDELIPNVSIKNVVVKEGKINCLKYTTVGFIRYMDEFLAKVKKMRNFGDVDNSEICLKFTFDGGDKSIKLSFQMHLLSDLQNMNSKKPYIANSLQTLLICSWAKINESAEALKLFLELSSFLDLYNSGYVMYFVGDLKVITAACGLTAGNSKFPCVFCCWQAIWPAGTERSVHFKESYDKRDIEKMNKALDNVNKGDQAKNNFSHQHYPVLDLFISDPKIIVPCELHILSGVINHIFDHLKKTDKETVRCWEKNSNVFRKGYHGGSFTGGQCRSLLQNRDILKEKHEEIWFFLEIFSTIVTTTFKNGKVSPSDYDKLEEIFGYCRKALEQTNLNMIHKMHWLCYHTFDWIQSEGLLLGSVSEQDGESLHHYFKKYDLYNHSHHNAAILPMIAWNAPRMGAYSPLQMRKKPKKKISLKKSSEIVEFSSSSDTDSDSEIISDEFLTKLYVSLG